MEKLVEQIWSSKPRHDQWDRNRCRPRKRPGSIKDPIKNHSKAILNLHGTSPRFTCSSFCGSRDGLSEIVGAIPYVWSDASKHTKTIQTTSSLVSVARQTPGVKVQLGARFFDAG